MKEALFSQASGQRLAIEGQVYPADAVASEDLWKERFAYRRAISRKDELGGREEVVTHHARPAVRFVWAGEEVVAPADSYRMESAPEAPGDSLLLTTEENVGFRSGDVALALGRNLGAGSIVVDQLALDRRRLPI